MLAWIRTGLSMMGFGFVVARFGLFLRELASTHGTPVTSHGQSLWAGVSLVALGVFTIILALFRYVELLKRLRAGQPAPLSVAPTAIVAVLLAFIGVFMSAYLVVTSR